MHPTLAEIADACARIVLGKDHQIRLALACLLARGHLLIEDVPGVGKTTLAHVLAHLLGLQFQRIQFTSDLLPADLIGVSIFDREQGTFRFHPGPVFAQLVLADEINRATPKAQSALLEAMEEHQVTADGNTLTLPEPFFVIATQNPSHQIGTFPLPESQLDRFMMRIELGYPAPEAERELLRGADRRAMTAKLQPMLLPPALQVLQREAARCHVSDAALDYIQALVAHTRRHPDFRNGLSPRGALALVQSARAWAYLAGRHHVLPEDVQTILGPVALHRLAPSADSRREAFDVRSLIEAVPIP